MRYLNTQYLKCQKQYCVSLLKLKTRDQTGDCDHTAAPTHSRLRPAQLRLLHCLVLFWNILNDLMRAFLLLADISGFRAICRYEKMQTSCFTQGSSGATVAILLAVLDIKISCMLVPPYREQLYPRFPNSKLLVYINTVWTQIIWSLDEFHVHWTQIIWSQQEFHVHWYEAFYNQIVTKKNKTMYFWCTIATMVYVKQMKDFYFSSCNGHFYVNIAFKSVNASTIKQINVTNFMH